MKFSFLTTALVAASAFAQQSGITINSLTGVTVCQPILISWTGGTPPYYLVCCPILPAGQPNASPLVTFPTTSATGVTWNVNLAVGVAGFLNLRDNTGAVGQSATFTVLNGSDTSCVTKSLSVSAGPTASGAGTSATSGGAVSLTSSSGPSKTSTSTTATKTSGAISQFSIGAAAALAAVALALSA